jgi:signal transduction histidine kinase
VVLPPPVREKLAELSPPAGLWGGPGLRPLPGPRGPLAEPVRPEFGGPGPADGLPNGAPPRRRPEPRYVIRTPAPSRYWVVVRTAARERERQVLTPLALLVRSETLSFGGLFFEVTPWLLAGGGVIVFSVLFWIPLVRSITRSVAQMTAATARIAEGRFDVRVDARRADELGLLGAGINRMAGRLEHLVSGQKRFLSDVAHELLTRALANLLRNAARYAGPAGPVTVSVQRHGSEVQLRVADHGPGIPETELGKVFDPFYRLDASRDRQTGGVGLGLAIVRTCVESCGGTVTAHNRAPQGLEVRIRLAAAQAPAATTP